MPWGAAAAVVGAGASLYGSSQASRSQQAGADAAIGEQRAQYDTTRSDNQTGLDARNNSLARMQELSGTFGSGPTQSQVMNSPGYQFGLSQGRNALENSAAAAGGLYSGATGRALVQYGNDYGTTKYDDQLNNLRNSQSDQFNRYAAISGQGQLGAGAINQAGMNSANNISGIQQGLGNAQGAASIANSNTWGGLANQLGSAGRSWFGGQPNPYTTPGRDGSYQNPSGGDFSGVGQSPGRERGGYADGGPVRVEPVVGTKATARQGGTGGGMSANAIIEMMKKPPASATNAIAQLTANPVTNPQAIIAEQMKREGEYSNGGAVHGPGGPRDDMIPAHLSNGEHVMDEASVTAMGDGDNEAGQAKLNKLRAMLKGAHHAN